MQKPTVVFIHGALNDHTVWAAQSRHFTDHDYHVLAPDLPGHGHTPGPALTSVAAMADWLLAMLEAAHIHHAALIGHSMGSLIALEAAAKAPQRVTHLGLVGTAYPMTVADTLLETARTDEARAIGMVAKWSHVQGHPAIDDLKLLMQRLARQNPDQLLHTDLAACNAYDQGLTAAASVRCPALLVCGASDVMTPPKAARALSEAIAHAQTVTLEAGHAMMTEQPDALSDALLSFIGSR